MSFKDFKLLLVVVFGTAAFMVSLRWVLGNSARPSFHEIEWNSRSLATEIAAGIEKDSTLTDATVMNAVLPLSISINQNTIAAPALHSKVLGGLKTKLSGLNDSAWEAYASAHFFPEPGSIRPEKNYTDTALSNVTVVYMDTAFPLKRVSYITHLPVKRYAYFDEFFSKYPVFGIWSLLIIIQLTLFVILLPWLFTSLFTSSTDPKITPIQLTNSVKGIYIVGIVAICIGLYKIILGGDGGYNVNVLLKHQYFMDNLDSVFGVVNGLGYVTAGLCLAGMLFSIIEIGNVAEDKPPSPAVIKYIDEQFKKYFTVVAIILSLAVFTTGTFFSALNSLDFIKQLSKAMGHSPVPNDLVYLYGLVHSFLLVIFYIPARYMLDKLKLNMVPPPEPQNWDSLKKLAGLAVAGSPLLAGMFQSLIDVFSK